MAVFFGKEEEIKIRCPFCHNDSFYEREISMYENNKGVINKHFLRKVLVCENCKNIIDLERIKGE